MNQIVPGPTLRNPLLHRLRRLERPQGRRRRARPLGHREQTALGVLDVTFAEDQSRLRKSYGAKNMAIIRHFAVNLIRSPPEPVR